MVDFVAIGSGYRYCRGKVIQPIGPETQLKSSVADPGSRILIFVHPGSKNSNKREGWKKFVVRPFFCGHKYHKIENYYIFKLVKTKIWTSLQRIIEFFTQKIVIKLSKLLVWDLGSEIRDRGVKIAPNPGAGSATLFKETICIFWWQDYEAELPVLLQHKFLGQLHLDSHARDLHMCYVAQVPGLSVC